TMAKHTRSECMMLMFIFQAEDGIRDASVTGVQTCALPIYERANEGERQTDPVDDRRVSVAARKGKEQRDGPPERGDLCQRQIDEIGRASCRERVVMRKMLGA